MKPTRKQKAFTIRTPSTRRCPVCQYERGVVQGVFLPHPNRQTLRVDKRGRTVGDACPMSGRPAPTVSDRED